MLKIKHQTGRDALGCRCLTGQAHLEAGFLLNDKDRLRSCLGANPLDGSRVSWYRHTCIGQGITKLPSADMLQQDFYCTLVVQFVLMTPPWLPNDEQSMALSGASGWPYSTSRPATAPLHAATDILTPRDHGMCSSRGSNSGPTLVMCTNVLFIRMATWRRIGC
jgi:hypothetical protein